MLLEQRNNTIQNAIHEGYEHTSDHKQFTLQQTTVALKRRKRLRGVSKSSSRPQKGQPFGSLLVLLRQTHLRVPLL